MPIFYSPLRYPGGKNCIFNFVSKLIRENNLEDSGYAEPYAGGAGLAVRLLLEGLVNHIYINDFDRSIYAFWKTIISDSEKFCRWIESVEVSTKSWDHFKKIQENQKNADLFELAQSTFFLNRTNVSGVIKGGIIGGKDQSGKYKIDARFNKQELIERIQKISKAKKKISVSNLDGLKFVDRMDRKNKEIFIYLDPPYYQKGANLYMNFYSKEDHQKLSEYVKNMNKRWMVSYDNHDFILNLYHERRKIVHKLSQSTSNRVGDEILVFSDGLKFDKSIEFLKEPMLLGL